MNASKSKSESSSEAQSRSENMKPITIALQNDEHNEGGEEEGLCVWKVYQWDERGREWCNFSGGESVTDLHNAVNKVKS